MTDKDQAPAQEIFYRFSGSGNAGWEINRPQPAIIKLVDQGIFHDQLLDIGCGIADNTIYIATHVNNVQITAIDLVPKAIEVAREKAETNNVQIQFEVVNILDDLSKTNLQEYSFDIILDSAIFHVFSNDDRQQYIDNLRRLIKAGDVYIQLVFSEKENREGGPRRIKKDDLIKLFSKENGWTIESIEETIYESRPETTLGANGQAYLSFIRKSI